MAIEIIKLNIKLKKAITAYKRLAIIWAIIIFLFYVNDPHMTFSFSVFAFIIGTLVLSLFLSGYQNFIAMFGLGFRGKNNTKIQQALKDKGFNIDYSAFQFAIDDQNKKFFFINTISGEVFIVDYSDIRSWYTETHERNRSNIVICTSNAQYPKFWVGYFGEDTASFWIARISALINE